MIYLLSCRNRDTGGPVVPGRLESGPGLGTLNQLQLEARVTVLLHGFNVNRPVGRQTLMELTKMVTQSTAGSLLAVLWPGDHWLGPLSYSFEGRDADDTAFELFRFLDDHLLKSADINFIAHSLGCRVTMETIKRLAAAGRNTGQVCMMAAAIDDDCLSTPGVYLKAGKQTLRMASLSSKKDKVLRYVYPVGDLLQAFLFWKDSWDLALGYHGARRHRRSDTLVPSNMLDKRIRKRRKVGHGDYMPDSPPNAKQIAAAKYASEVIGGVGHPDYG